MPKVVKKRKVITENKTTQKLNPQRIKKPICEIHNEQMNFDMVRQVFVCNVTDCRLIARPKRGDNEKTVVIGKGAVQMRLVRQGNSYSVVLISDDNVALDITPMIDVIQIKGLFEVEKNANIFKENQRHETIKGPDEFLIPDRIAINLFSNLLVMGETQQ